MASLLTYDNFIHALAGSTANGAAMTIFYPLDTIRSRLQLEEDRKAKNTILVMRDIINEEGFSSLYLGLRPVLYSLFTSGFVYFYSFHGLRRYGGEKSAIKDLMFGAIAGSINVLLTTPLWVANTRIKMQKQVETLDQSTGVTKNDDIYVSNEDSYDDCDDNKHEGEVTKSCILLGNKIASKKQCMQQHFSGLIDAMIKIARKEGLSALWSGTLSSLLLVSNPAIQFAIFEMLRRNLQRRLQTKELSPFHIFALGSVAKTISTLVSYPLQVVQTKKRYGAEQTRNKSIIEVLSDINKREGISGLYRGMEAKLIQTVLTTSLMYVFYEEIYKFVTEIGKSTKQTLQAAV